MVSTKKDIGVWNPRRLKFTNIKHLDTFYKADSDRLAQSPHKSNLLYKDVSCNVTTIHFYFIPQTLVRCQAIVWSILLLLIIREIFEINYRFFITVVKISLHTLQQIFLYQQLLGFPVILPNSCILGDARSRTNGSVLTFRHPLVLTTVICGIVATYFNYTMLTFQYNQETMEK